MARAWQAAVLAALAASCFIGLARDLWTPDEPREAEIGREMWVAPSIVPTLNGERFLEKPPLYYWAVAGTYALGGGPAAVAARSVSAVASLLTLLLVYLWGRRAFTPQIGLAAVIGLATSVQFALTTHWIVMDSLLMLFTTAALFAAFERLRGRGGVGALLGFHAALAGALLTKGLIGPVLIACALLGYAAARRSIAVLRPLRPWIGVGIVVTVTALLVLAIGADSGASGVREWLWVNHVERFLHPEGTGHDQPFYYYLIALPTAVLPWWLPLAAVLRKRAWTAGVPERDTRLFLGCGVAAMALLLSAAATKRGLYVLPLLPPLFLLLAAAAADWWRNRAFASPATMAWTAQGTCVVLLAVTPVLLVLGYLRTADARAWLYLGIVAALVYVLARAVRRGERAHALAALGACAGAAVIGLLGVAAPLAGPSKDLTPFVAWIGAQVPLDQPLYVVGEFDETVRGIVPFVTARPVVPLPAEEVASVAPPFVLVQSKSGAADAATLPAPYTRLAERVFGPGRYLALWSRQVGGHATQVFTYQGSRSEPRF
jgi:4-amino-4-deoxy-L-arabinose transferase-like glycosyltransferase